MRRPRLELVLIVVLTLALVALLVFPGAPEVGEDPPAAALPAPAPCDPALADAGDVEPPGRRDVEAVATVVEDLRDLRFERLPEPSYLGSEEFVRRVTEDLSPPEADLALDARLLALLGAVPEGFDLEDHLAALTADQVIGFYDPDTEDLVVRTEAGEGDPGPNEVLTLAHELGHALTDQAVGLPDLEEVRDDPEAAAAATALVEGDAMIVTQLYAAEALPLRDQLSLVFSIPGAAPPIGDTPHFLLRSMTFPYIEGMAFACALYREDGWSAVDRAYEAPPTTTAEVLFPERYLDEETVREPEEPQGLLALWDPEPPRTFGAADILFLFEAPGGDPSRALPAALDGAEAWGGGVLHAWTSGEQLAASVRVVQREGGADLCAAMAAWYRRSFLDVSWSDVSATLRTARHQERGAALRCDGDEVRLGIGPDVPTAVRATA